MSSDVDPEDLLFKGIPPGHLRAIAEDEPLIDYLLERAKAALAAITICPPQENLSLHLAVKMGEAMNGAALQCRQAFDWYALENSVVEMMGVALRLLLEGDEANGISSPYEKLGREARARRYYLCQDCLAVQPHISDRDEIGEVCSCGGDLCCCEGCSKTARLLLLGERRGLVLELQKPDVLPFWCAETGTRRS